MKFWSLFVVLCVLTVASASAQTCPSTTITTRQTRSSSGTLVAVECLDPSTGYLSLLNYSGFTGNGPITTQYANARISALSAAVTDSVGLSLTHTGAAEWQIRTDTGNGTLLRFGSGPGGGAAIQSEFMRFGAGVYFGKTLAYIPMTVPAPETTTESVFRLLGGSGGTSTTGASSMEIFSFVDDPISLTNFSRIRIATGTSAGVDSGFHAILSENQGTGTLQPIEVGLSTNGGAITKLATFGLPASAQPNLSVFGTTLIQTNSVFGTTLQVDNSGSPGGTNWGIQSTGSSNTPGAGKICFNDSGGTGVYRFCIDTSGNLYINNASNVVFRCATAGTLPIGALTINSGSCGTTTDTGLRVK